MSQNLNHDDLFEPKKTAPLGCGDYRAVLRMELDQRRLRNPKYSQTAFARDMRMRSNRLSEVLSGKQGLSAKAALSVAECLGYAPMEKDHFCDLVMQLHGRSHFEKEAARKRIEERQKEVSYRQIRIDSFKVISEWYHLAIIELSKLEEFKNDPQWIADALSITTEQVTEALVRLERMGMLCRSENRWSFKNGDNRVPGGMPAACIKNFHTQILRKAIRALYAQSLERREYSSLMIAVDRDKLPQIKERIRKFWRSIDREFGRKGKKTDVYCMGLQFFSLTKGNV